ncbi:MAG TPA: phosphatase PAP2 family protein [Cytophagaceae bacterium]
MYLSIINNKSLNSYFAVIIVFWLVASSLVMYLGYHQSFLVLNQYHNPYLDYIVPHLTHFGDSLILASLFLMLLSYRESAMAFTIVASIIISGLILLSLKYLVFTDWHRPLKVLGEEAGIHYIKGHVEYYNTFPSGHTTTIFSAFLLVASLFNNKIIQVLVAIAAIVCAYTRVYLGAHFLGDVLAGSILGTSVAMLCLHYVYPWIAGKLQYKENAAKKKISLIATIIGIIGFLIGITSRYLF